MARKAFDHRPGPLPDIQMGADSVTYTFDLVDVAHVRLVIRCDAHGEVWASIPPAAAAPSPPTTE